jgi:hypothetical protein
VVESDIANCFEAIPHDRLVAAVEERVCDRQVLKLLRVMLRAGVMLDGAVRRSGSGTPQGGLCSAEHNPPCVAPATCSVTTPPLAAALEPAAERAALVARQPHGRLVQPEEVAAAIAYLASPLAGSTTRTAIDVDGGMAGLRLPPPRPGTA